MCIKLSPCTRHWSEHFTYVNSLNPYTEGGYYYPHFRDVSANIETNTYFSLKWQKQDIQIQAVCIQCRGPNHEWLELTSTPVPAVGPWTRSGQCKHCIDSPPEVIDLKGDVLAMLGQSCPINANPRSSAWKLEIVSWNSVCFLWPWTWDRKALNAWEPSCWENLTIKPMQIRSKRSSW